MGLPRAEAGSTDASPQTGQQGSLPEGPQLPVVSTSPGLTAPSPGSDRAGSDAPTAPHKPGQGSVPLALCFLHSEALREEALELSGKTDKNIGPITILGALET